MAEKLTPKDRIYEVLSKGGKVAYGDCNEIGKAIWIAWERGYYQAVKDIQSNLIKIRDEQ